MKFWWNNLPSLDEASKKFQFSDSPYIAAGWVWEDVYADAKERINKLKPQISEQKKCAFANCAASLYTSFCYSVEKGPSVREIVLEEYIRDNLDKIFRAYTYKQVIEYLLSENGAIFGPITADHLRVWKSGESRDDDPDDIRQMRAMS